MKIKKERQQVLSVRVTVGHRRLLELLASRLTEKRGCYVTLTDVVEEALSQLAKKEGVRLCP